MEKWDENCSFVVSLLQTKTSTTYDACRNWKGGWSGNQLQQSQPPSSSPIPSCRRADTQVPPLKPINATAFQQQALGPLSAHCGRQLVCIHSCGDMLTPGHMPHVQHDPVRHQPAASTLEPGLTVPVLHQTHRITPHNGSCLIGLVRPLTPSLAWPLLWHTSQPLLCPTILHYDLTSPISTLYTACRGADLPAPEPVGGERARGGSKRAGSVCN